MRTTLAIVAACGLAGSAAAQTTSLLWEVSPSLAGPYAPSIDVNPGVTVYIQLRVQFHGTEPAIGLANLAQQPTLSNWYFENGDAVRYDESPTLGRIPPFRSAGTGASGEIVPIQDANHVLRFAGSKATTITTNLAWGINSAQLTHQLGGTNYNSNLDVVVFRYAVTMSDMGGRDMLATTPSEGINHPSGQLPRATWYASDNGTDLPNIVATISPEDIFSATIHVIPAPGPCALLALGLIAPRRRHL